MCFLSEISGCLTTSPTKDNLVGEIYDVNCNKENKMNNDTLTSVQKDGLTADPLIIDDIYKDREARVYDDVSPTMRSGHDTMKVAEPQPYDENYPHVREFDSKEEADAYIESLRIPQATKQGYIEVPPGSVFDASYPDSKTRRGRVQEGGQVSPTLMAGGEAPCYYEGVSVHPNGHALEFKGEQSIKQDAAPALRATDYKCPHVVWEKEPSYRIRKLTPRECFRLMGVSETNIDKIQQSGVSQSQQYKMAGNSIVVDCLYHLFRKMLTETHCESQQLSLF